MLYPLETNGGRKSEGPVSLLINFQIDVQSTVLAIRTRMVPLSSASLSANDDLTSSHQGLRHLFPWYFFPLPLPTLSLPTVRWVDRIR